MGEWVGGWRVGAAGGGCPAAAQAASSPSPGTRHGWSPRWLPRDGGNGPGARAAGPQPATEISAQEQGQLQWQGLTLCLAPPRKPQLIPARTGSARRPAGLPVPPAASLGSVPSPARGRDRQDGRRAGGGIAEHVAAVPEGWWGGCSRRPVGSRRRLWAGGWVQLLGTCSHGPLPTSPGDALGADGSGSSAIGFWHSYEPTSSACLPVVHPARRGAQGHGVPGAACLWGHALLLLTTLPLSAQQISAVPEREMHGAVLALRGPHRGQLSPPGMGLKP